MTNRALHHLEKCVGHLGRRGSDADPRLAKSLDLRRSRSFATADNRSGMAHPAAWWRGRSRDETGDRFAAVALNPFGSLFFRGTTDFANHNDAVSFRVGIEQLNDVEVRGAIDRVAADAD